MYASVSQDMLLNSSKMINQDSWMADLDPMLEGGYRIAFHQPFPVQIRQPEAETKNITANRDILTMRILVRPTVQSYSQLKLQITSQSNIFKTYTCYVDQKRFERIKKSQQLNFGYNAFLNMLVKQLNFCYKNPEQYSAVLYQGQVGSPILEFSQNIEYKSIELLSLDFQELDQQTNRQCVSYRFSYMKAKTERIQNRIKEVYGILKLKNPNLLTLIMKKNALNQSFNHIVQK